MQRFLRDCNAAVTVFVTLLLIPAILVSGTAVDLARIYTAKSIVQDANQLAANSVLASYEAMLQDLYGVFGVMQDDPILGGMLDEYIQVTVFGEDWKNTGSGTFQLFYGSNLQPAVVSPAREQNLRNVEVLRRQIEEYAKYRAPVVIVQDILDRIESFKKVKHDAEAIDKKMQIDSKIGEIDKLYRQIFSLIQEINGYQTTEDNTFSTINNILDEINQQLQLLRGTRNDYTSSFDAGDTEAAADHEGKYNGIKSNIRALIAGGTVLTQWQPGTPGSPGSPGSPGTPARPGVPATPAIPATPATPATSGSWLGSRHSNGLTAAIRDGKSSLKSYKDKLDTLVQKCTEADIKKQELSRLVDELEQKLNSGECTEDLKIKMQLLITDYRGLLKYELKKMAEAMQAKDSPYIDSVITKLDGVSYGNVATNSPVISKENLQNLNGNAGFDIDLEVINRTLHPDRPDPLTPLAGLGSSQYRYPVPKGFVLFQSTAFSSTDNPEFYSVLSLWYTSSSGPSQQQRDNAADNITGIIGAAQDLLKGLLDYDPHPGAEYYKPQIGESQGSFGSPGTGVDEMASFGTDGNWDEEGVGMEKTREALGSSIFSQIGEAMGKVGDKILLLTYDSEMFSNWTSDLEENPITMSGAPLGPDINYFYKSEQEYLIHGNAGDAAANLKAVAGLTLLVRFVFNYTSTFLVPEVSAEIQKIKVMFMAVPPFAIFISELARVGYALCESAYDLSRLRNNEKVVLLKMDSADWTFSLKGLISDLAKPKVKVTASSLSKPMDAPVKNDEKGLSYSDYLKLYLLFVNGDTLAARTADLISLNMTNKQLGLEADEAAMAGAELFDLQKAITGFSIQSTVDLRMLFLSMPFAQKGVNGVVPPKTLPINVTDYRGY